MKKDMGKKKKMVMVSSFSDGMDDVFIHEPSPATVKKINITGGRSGFIGFKTAVDNNVDIKAANYIMRVQESFKTAQAQAARRS